MRGAALLCVLLGACSFDLSGPGTSADGGGGGGDGGGGATDAPVQPSADAGPDGAPPADAPPPDGGPPADIGAPCSAGGGCGAGQFCLTEEDGWGAAGYCTALCDFDDDCGDDSFCSPDLGGLRICLAECSGDDEECDEPGQVCALTIDGIFPLGEPGCIPGNPGAADGDPCTGFADCAAEQFCLDNPFEAPGGECITIDCTVGDPDSCAEAGDGVCLAIGSGLTACFDHCKSDDDCRDGEGWECADGGNVCFYAHAEPGSACATNGECGSEPWKCLKGSDFPGGYCGGDDCDPLDSATCPTDAVCYDPTPDEPPDGKQYCAVECLFDGDCRTAQGYRCLPSDEEGGPEVCRLP